MYIETNSGSIKKNKRLSSPVPVRLVVLPKPVSRPVLQLDARTAVFLPRTLHLESP